MFTMFTVYLVGFKKTTFSESYNEAIETTQSMDSSNFGYLQPGRWIPQPLPAHDDIYIYIYVYINQFLKQINLENFFEKRKEGRRPSP